MSASLVGSEMCIRDSILASLEQSCRGSDQRPLTQGGDVPLKYRPEFGDCLLYTSDAADDM
eukprot:5253344-Alexandrium_andersonii.AAC.1